MILLGSGKKKVGFKFVWVCFVLFSYCLCLCLGIIYVVSCILLLLKHIFMCFLSYGSVEFFLRFLYVLVLPIRLQVI